MPTPDRLAEIGREAERDAVTAIGELAGATRARADAVASL
jgi:two-component system cell cycle sensor histidine kinase PleC